MAQGSTSRPGHRHCCWFDAAPGAVLLWACTNEMLVRQGFGLSRLRGGAASAIATSCHKDDAIFVVRCTSSPFFPPVVASTALPRPALVLVGLTHSPVTFRRAT